MIRQAGRIAWRAFNRFQDHNGPGRAAAVAYYTLLSLLPLSIFLISLGVLIVGSFEAAYSGTLIIISGVVVHMDEPAREALRTFTERALVGSDPSATLCVSGLRAAHLELAAHNGRFWARDLSGGQSFRSGTPLGGEFAELEHGTLLLLGGATMVRFEEIV